MRKEAIITKRLPMALSLLYFLYFFILQNVSWKIIFSLNYFENVYKICWWYEFGILWFIFENIVLQKV